MKEIGESGKIKQKGEIEKKVNKNEMYSFDKNTLHRIELCNVHIVYMMVIQCQRYKYQMHVEYANFAKLLQDELYQVQKSMFNYY